MKFKCAECLVFSCCSKICEGVLEIPSDFITHCIKLWICPDCGSRIRINLNEDNYTCVECNHSFHKINNNKYARVLGDNFDYPTIHAPYVPSVLHEIPNSIACGKK